MFDEVKYWIALENEADALCDRLIKATVANYSNPYGLRCHAVLDKAMRRLDRRHARMKQAWKDALGLGSV